MARDDWDDGVIFEDETPSTRPFVVVSNKTSATTVSVETLVEAKSSPTDARFEKRKLLERAQSAISVAELSSHLAMPIGTTMVLVDELINEGMMIAHQTRQTSQLSDLNIMTRIIQRVREL